MNKKNWIVGGVIALVLILVIITAVASSAPSSFPSNATFTVKDGETLTGIARDLNNRGLIRSVLLFRVYTTILGQRRGSKAGDYLFTQPESALRIAYRLTHGENGFPLIKVTIPEGLDSRAVTSILVKSIPGLAKTDLLALMKKDEGKLFPETYFWPTNVKPDRIVSDMRAEFDTRIATIKNDTDKFGKPIDDVIKMASIVEKEATSSIDRRIVAGILWKRIDARMALQVDPPFEYFLNKTSNKLTLDDLKVESPYNLYLHTGLPPTAIDNPGLNAILDTIIPTKTAYWYYLSDKNGVMHYAKTHDGHIANKNKYLK